MLVVLNAFTPFMLVPPAMVLVIVITFLIALVISAIAFHDTARCECHQCHEQAAQCKTKYAHGVLLVENAAGVCAVTTPTTSTLT
jgi:uncharacterized membrane protein